MLSQLRSRPILGSSFLKPSRFSRPLSSTVSWRKEGELNKVSATVTQPKSQGASQAMRSFPSSGVFFLSFFFLSFVAIADSRVEQSVCDWVEAQRYE